MSSIVCYNNNLSFDMDSHNGFKIEEFERQEKDWERTSENDSLYPINDRKAIDDDGSFDYSFDYINGRGRNALLSGGDNIDAILGGAGDDNDDDGNNVIDDGAGNDTFVFEFFNHGMDRITDCKVGEDTIEICGVGSDANVDYNQDTGSLSVNGEEIAAELDNWNDDSYEVF